MFPSSTASANLRNEAIALSAGSFLIGVITNYAYNQYGKSQAQTAFKNDLASINTMLSDIRTSHPLFKHLEMEAENFIQNSGSFIDRHTYNPQPSSLADLTSYETALTTARQRLETLITTKKHDALFASFSSPEDEKKKDAFLAAQRRAQSWLNAVNNQVTFLSRAHQMSAQRREFQHLIGRMQATFSALPTAHPLFAYLNNAETFYARSTEFIKKNTHNPQQLGDYAAALANVTLQLITFEHIELTSNTARMPLPDPRDSELKELLIAFQKQRQLYLTALARQEQAIKQAQQISTHIVELQRAHQDVTVLLQELTPDTIRTYTAHTDLLKRNLPVTIFCETLNRKKQNLINLLTHIKTSAPQTDIIRQLIHNTEEDITTLTDVHAKLVKSTEYHDEQAIIEQRIAIQRRDELQRLHKQALLQAEHNEASRLHRDREQTQALQNQAAAAHEQAAAQRRANQLQSDKNTIKAQKLIELKQHVPCRDEQKRLQGRINDLTDEKTHLNHRLKEADNKYHGTKRHHDQLIIDKNAEKGTLEKDLKTAQAEKTRLAKELNETAQKHQQTLTDLEKLQKESTPAQETIQKLTAQEKVLQESVRELTQRVGAAETRANRLQTLLQKQGNAWPAVRQTLTKIAKDWGETEGFPNQDIKRIIAMSEEQEKALKS